MNIVYAVNERWRRKCFAPEDERRIAAVGRVIEAPVPARVDPAFLRQFIPSADVVITSWDTAPLDAPIVCEARQLKLLAHAAGSVKPVVSPELWRARVRVTSAAAAISYGVAEFCLAMMLLGSKRAFWAGNACRTGAWQDGASAFHGPHEIYGQSVGVIGAGHVGRRLLQLLGSFSCRRLLHDPCVSAQRAAEMGAEKVESLDELFSRCAVVSLNAPNIPQTRHLIGGRHLRLLRDGGLFINTSRGAIVNETEMIEELRRGRIVACLDVTEQEPPPADHPLRQLPNVWLTPHMAGVTAENMLRIGSLVADEIEAFAKGEPPKHEVTEQQLATMA